MKLVEHLNVVHQVGRFLAPAVMPALALPFLLRLLPRRLKLRTFFAGKLLAKVLVLGQATGKKIIPVKVISTLTYTSKFKGQTPG